MVEVVETVRAILLGMGNTSDAVAETLRVAECPGVRGAGEACPIARYLRLTGYENVFVDGNMVSWGQGSKVWFALPPHAVAVFIARFDDGGFPDLVTTKEVVCPLPR